MFIRVISLLALLSYSHLSISVVRNWDLSCKNVFVIRNLDTNLTELKKHAQTITHVSNASAIIAGTHLILAMKDSLTITEAIIFLSLYGPLAAIIKAADREGLVRIKSNMRHVLKTTYPNQFKKIDFDKIYQEAFINRAWIGDPGKRILGLVLVAMSVTSLAVYQSIDAFVFTLLGGTLGVSGYITDKKFENLSIENFRDKLSHYFIKLRSKGMNPTDSKLQIADFDNSTKPK